MNDSVSAEQSQSAEPAGASTSVEDVFNKRLEQALVAKGLQHRDLLELLEASNYTPDTPATVLLNDAFAIAAVLDISPAWLLTVDDEAEHISVTPATRTTSRRLRDWIRGLRPLRDRGAREFYHFVPADDTDASIVAENWIRADRARVAALTFEIGSAIEAGDIGRVTKLVDRATEMVDRAALMRANQRVEELVSQKQLDAARIRGIRFRRQRPPDRR